MGGHRPFSNRRPLGNRIAAARPLAMALLSAPDQCAGLGPAGKDAERARARSTQDVASAALDVLHFGSEADIPRGGIGHPRWNLPCPRLLVLRGLKHGKSNAKSQKSASEGTGEKSRQINR